MGKQEFRKLLNENEILRRQLLLGLARAPSGSSVLFLQTEEGKKHKVNVTSLRKRRELK